MSEILYTDVLVVGAGPVGALIGLGLAQQGLDTLIVGRFANAPSVHIGIPPSSILNLPHEVKH